MSCFGHRCDGALEGVVLNKLQKFRNIADAGAREERASQRRHEAAAIKQETKTADAKYLRMFVGLCAMKKKGFAADKSVRERLLEISKNIENL